MSAINIDTNLAVSQMNEAKQHESHDKQEQGRHTRKGRRHANFEPSVKNLNYTKKCDQKDGHLGSDLRPQGTLSLIIANCSMHFAGSGFKQFRKLRPVVISDQNKTS